MNNINNKITNKVFYDILVRYIDTEIRWSLEYENHRYKFKILKVCYIEIF